MSSTVGTAIFLAGLAAGALLPLRFGMLGFLCGVVCVWISIALRIEALNWLLSGRDCGVMDALWVHFIGWPFGMSWGVPFLGINWFRRWRSWRMERMQKAGSDAPSLS